MPPETTTFVEDVRKLPLGLVWVAVVVFAGIVVGVFDPYQALLDVIANQGLSEEQISAGGFIAGYALPFTVATAIVVAGAMNGWFAESGAATAFWIAVIYWIAGYASKEFGLGLAPADIYQTVSGHPLFAIPLNVLSSYFTSYGAPLILAALALGVAAGLQIDRWSNGHGAPAGG